MHTLLDIREEKLYGTSRKLFLKPVPVAVDIMPMMYERNTMKNDLMGLLQDYF